MSEQAAEAAAVTSLGTRGRRDGQAQSRAGSGDGGASAPRRPPARLMRVLNVPMRAVLGLPFPTPMGRRLMLVHHVGRKTGRRYRQPVSYAAMPDGALLTPGGGRWVRNLTDGLPVHIQLRGRKVLAVPELISDPGQLQEALGAFSAANPFAARFIPLLSGGGAKPRREALEAAARHGFRMVRWHLER